MKNNQGFTLIELMVVVAIIGVLASISLPAYQDYIYRSKTTEAMSFFVEAKGKINNYYKEKYRFPTNNAQAGLPEPQQLIGNYVTQVVVENGTVHVTMGNKVGMHLENKIISFRPAVVIGSPSSPIAWLCAADKPVSGMKAIGDNKTTVEAKYLPANCR